jgi:hypothetical protein
MIKEFLRYKNLIETRAVTVGRLLQSERHFRYAGIQFPTVHPFILAFVSGPEEVESVSVVVGCNTARDYVFIDVPEKLFDSGTDIDIRNWVRQQNRQGAVPITNAAVVNAPVVGNTGNMGNAGTTGNTENTDGKNGEM